MAGRYTHAEMVEYARQLLNTMDMPYDGPSDDRILERNAPPPAERLSEAWPASSPQLDALAPMLGGEENLRIFLFNKNHPSERLCPACRNRYKKPTAPATRAEDEQELSGICSSTCFIVLNGPGGFKAEEWIGKRSETCVVVHDEQGNVVGTFHETKDDQGR